MLVSEQRFEIPGMVKRAASSRLERQAGNVHCAPALRQCLLVELKPIHRHSLKCFLSWSCFLLLLLMLGLTDAQSQLISAQPAQGTAACLGGC